MSNFKAQADSAKTQKLISLILDDNICVFFSYAQTNNLSLLKESLLTKIDCSRFFFYSPRNFLFACNKKLRSNLLSFLYPNCLILCSSFSMISMRVSEFISYMELLYQISKGSNNKFNIVGFKLWSNFFITWPAIFLFSSILNGPIFQRFSVQKAMILYCSIHIAQFLLSRLLFLKKVTNDLLFNLLTKGTIRFIK